MTADTTPRRVTGPLRSWYDLHEALGHEARALADLAPTLTPDEPEAFGAFDDRLGRFRTGLRHHSEVEDVVKFPALAAAGARVRDSLVAHLDAEDTEILTQVPDHFDAVTWDVVVTRTPELAALVIG